MATRTVRQQNQYESLIDAVSAAIGRQAAKWPTPLAHAALNAVPDGWAKVKGQWVQLVECGRDFNVSQNTDDWPIYRTDPKWL